MIEMICSSCGKQIPDTSRFCNYCGANNNQKICPHCGHTLPLDSVFCNYCGKNVDQESDDAPSPAEASAVSTPSNNQSTSKKPMGCMTGFFLVLGISVALIVLPFLIGSLSSNNSKDSSQSSNSAQSPQIFNNAGKIYDAAKDFANNNDANAFKQYKDLYTYSNAVIIEKGATVDVYIVWGKSAYIYCEADTSIVSPKWSDSLRGSTATLSLTGLKEGTSVIRVYSEENDHELYLLAIVVDVNDSSRGGTGTAGQVYNGIKDFAKITEANDFKRFDEFFTYSNAVIIKKGTTVDVSIACLNNCTIYYNVTDTSIASPDWSGDSWAGNRAKLTITGIDAGTSEITLSNSFNDHELKILAIVVD